MSMPESQESTSSFRFNKLQLSLHSLFIAANIYLAFFQLMPRQIALHPPAEENLAQSFLTPFLGKKRDSHDEQWEAFRANLPIMMFTMVGWKFACKSFVRIKNSLQFWGKKKREEMEEEEQGLLRSHWLGLMMLCYSYRADILLFLSVLIMWYILTKKLYRCKFVIPLSWFLMISFLYLNEKNDHFRFVSEWVEQFIPIQFFKNREAPILWTNILNMNFLRMISFTMDCYWGQQALEFQSHAKKCQSCEVGDLCYRGRDLKFMPEISLKNYMEYMLFAPTCLAGPPISFKSFHSFKKNPTKVSPPFLRWALIVVIFELYQHFYPVITPAPQQNLLQMGFSSLLFLYFIFLKFSVIWKTGRLWSLYYGVDVIDNMGRCMFNNYGFEKFWRMWHKGFNHWLIRYLYIPLGGNKNVFSVLAVIVFVAFWHDHSIKIILWALILVIFMIPELLVKAFFRRKYRHLYSTWWFKYICAFACGVYIQIICTCNLIGFGYGAGNAWIMVQRIKDEAMNFAYMLVVLASACILMFAVREYQVPKRND